MARSILTDYTFNNVSKITNLPSPTASGDAANKAYVDSVVEGISWKNSARVATQSNINLSSPGATIDGITMATNDRVLVRNQSTASQNGIYIWNGAAVPMTRSADASTAAELEQATINVQEGTNTNASFRQTAINFTLDSDSVTFDSFGTSAPPASETTAGIAELATQSEVDTGTDSTRIVTPATLANWSGKPKRYATTIGDGSATQYTITHGLNTRNVLVQTMRNSGNYETVEPDVERTGVNTVRLTFATPPALNEYAVVVVG